MTDEQPTLCPIDHLTVHPDHPRAVVREDVVERLAAELVGEYPRRHALHGRPRGNQVEVLAGKHRLAAAVRAGLTHVWVWLAPLDDEAAQLAMLTDNTQAELSGLEVGDFLRRVVTAGAGGRGNVGDLARYAAKLRKDERYLRRLMTAAEVAGQAPDLYPRLLHHANHLAPLSRVHASVRPALIPLILKHEWSTKQAEGAAKKVAAVFGEGFDPSAPVWVAGLDPKPLAQRLATDEGYTPGMAHKLIAEAGRAAAVASGDPIGAAQQQLQEGLQTLNGENALRANRVRQLGAEIANGLKAPARGAGWHFGDWREHVHALADGSVSAVITDPSYGMNYQNPAGGHAPLANDGSPAEAAAEWSAALAALLPKLIPQAHVFVFCNWHCVWEFEQALVEAGFDIRSRAVWVKDRHGTGDLNALAPMYELILHATRGGAALYQRAANVFVYERVDTERHPTEKPQDLIERLVDIATARGDLIADPFGGVATTAAAVLKLGRAYWSCEIDKVYFDRGTKRLAEMSQGKQQVTADAPVPLADPDEPAS